MAEAAAAALAAALAEPYTPPPQYGRSHPKAPYLRLVSSQESPAFLNFGSGDLLKSMLDAVKHWRAVANPEDRTA